MKYLRILIKQLNIREKALKQLSKQIKIDSDALLQKKLDVAAKIEKYLDDIHILGYCPEGDVIADACVFLVSEKARFITGNIMPVSGGAELGYRRVQ